jgi:uncharacterized metal-binding protein
VPSGRVHEAINLTFFAGLAAGYAYARAQGMTGELEQIMAPQTLTAFTTSYLIGTFLVTPDLDLAEQGVRAKSNWGLLGLLWIPYGALFSHRGLSHSWIVGPLTRILYLMIVFLAVSWVAAQIAPYFGYGFSMKGQIGENWRELATGALIGYYLAQWLHLVADGIAPDHGMRQAARRSRR